MRWKVVVGRHPHESLKPEYDWWATVTDAADYDNPGSWTWTWRPFDREL